MTGHNQSSIPEWPGRLDKVLLLAWSAHNKRRNSNGRVSMKISLAAVAGFVLAGAISASAQDALMNSAETINRRNFKFAGYPIFLLNEGNNETGVGLRAGYGFGRRFDAEAK